MKKTKQNEYKKDFSGFSEKNFDVKPQINFAMNLEIELTSSNYASVIEIILCAGILIFCTFKDKVLYQSYLKNN